MTNNEALAACWLMILIGAVTWLALTHLVGRFAIVLLVPCALMFALAWTVMRTQAARLTMVVILIATAAWNGRTAWGLFTSPETPYLELEMFGQTEWITDGNPIGPPHLPRLNHILAEGQKVLVVADARRFYLDRGADYCVVFNPNPFADAAAHLPVAELIQWLQDQGYAYVYVDWSEMQRLRSSRYGFWPSLTPALFTQLTPTGLRPIENFSLDLTHPPHANQFAVP